MFRTTDLKTVRRVLSSCYLGDWWVLYQIGRNSNTHFFRYLLRHIELCICAKERQQKSAQVSGVRLKVTNGSGRHRRSHPRGGIDLGSGGNTSYEEDDDEGKNTEAVEFLFTSGSANTVECAAIIH